MKTYNKFLGTLVKHNKEYAYVFDSDITLDEAHQIMIHHLDEVDITFMSKLEFKSHPDAVSVIAKHGL